VSTSWSRRAFLGSAAACVSLPFLESLAPGSGAARAQTAPVRLLFYYVPNGIHMPSWTPSQTGPGFDLPYILEPLATVQDDVLVLTGLANRSGEFHEPGDHARGTAAFLTCERPFLTAGADIELGISVDQVAAQALGNATSFPSLQLGLQGGASTGSCDSGYSCAYTRNISWADANTPLPKMVNPRLVFDRLFAGHDPGATAEDIERRRRYRTSVLDHVHQQAQSLSRRMSRSDVEKLEEFMTGVREVENRIAMGIGECSPPARPTGDEDLSQQVRLMSDLMVLALRCDLSRYITFMLANAASLRSYSFLGVSGAHHAISHHQNDPDNIAKLEIIDRWEVEQLAYLLESLKATPEGDGNLLDNTLVFFSSEIEDGNAHRHYNLPVLLAGRGGGAVDPGRHIDYGAQVPMANLFVSMLRAAVVDATQFGSDSTGELGGLV
jgi:hypothetical protein